MVDVDPTQQAGMEGQSPLDYAGSRRPDSAINLGDIIGLGNWFRGLLGDSERRVMAEIAEIRREYAETTTAHVAEHLALIAKRDADHKRYDEFIDAKELADQYRAGQMSALTFLVRSIAPHARWITGLLLSLGIAAGLLNGSVRIGLGP